MSITRRCDYACRIIRAAYRSGDTYISIAEVAERAAILMDARVIGACAVSYAYAAIYPFQNIKHSGF